MPLYEYQCQQCKRHTEKRQKFSDPEITQCPHCGGHLVRVISAPNIAFKGGGWYKDLYSSPKPTGGDAAKSEASGEGKGDSAAKATESSAKPEGGSSDASSSPTPTAPAAAPATAPPAASSPASSKN